MWLRSCGVRIADILRFAPILFCGATNLNVLCRQRAFAIVEKGEQTMIELMKQRFELFVKMRWLKTIEKETDKYSKLKSKLSRQQHVVNALLAEYSNKYGESLRKGGE